MASLSIRVMAHPKRKTAVDDILTTLESDDSIVIWDRYQDRIDTGRRAWMDHDPTAKWHMVIQDDLRVTNGFVPVMERALDFVPDDVIVCPYVGTRRPVAMSVEQAARAAIKDNAAWIKMRGLNWGVAICHETKHIDEMLAFYDQQSYPNYDRRIGRFWVDVMRRPTWCTWPSLVDHRRDMKSLVGHGRGRYAHQFLVDATTLPDDYFDGPVVTMGNSFGFARAVQRQQSAEQDTKAWYPKVNRKAGQATYRRPKMISRTRRIQGG